MKSALKTAFDFLAIFFGVWLRVTASGSAVRVGGAPKKLDGLNARGHAAPFSLRPPMFGRLRGRRNQVERLAEHAVAKWNTIWRMSPYREFTTRLKLLIGKNPHLITTTLGNIFSMRSHR